MTINNPDLYNQAWDWHFLKGCFGETIEPTDIDGCVERNGKFLWIETKKPGVDIPLGQRILLKALANRGDTVLIIWGNKNEPETFAIWYKDQEEIVYNATPDILRQRCSSWYNWVNNN